MMDAAQTLIEANDERADEAVQSTLDMFRNGPFRLLRMEAGLLAGSIGQDGPDAKEAKAMLASLDHELGSPEGFRSRWLPK